MDSGQPGMTWPQSVDESLIFGWIDGVRKSTDKNSYSIHFIPRKPTSIWSAINIEKVETLTKLGLMKTVGLERFKLRTIHKSKIYSHENELATLTSEFVNKFKKNKKA